MTRPFEPVVANALRGLPCADIVGGRFPEDRKWCREALRRHFDTRHILTNGGQAFAVAFDDLPLETRTALLQRRDGAEANGGQPDPELWQALAGAPAGVRREAERRLGIVREYRARLERGLGKFAAADAIGPSYNTLRRYLALIEDVPSADWLPALAPAWKPGGRSVACAEVAWDFFLGDYLHPNGPQLASAYRRTARHAKREGLAWPAIDTIRRKLKREVPEAELVLARQGTKALDNLYPPQHRDATSFYAGQAWNSDGIEPSVMIEFPDGHVGRASVFICQDIFSRKLLGFQIDRFESGDQVRALLWRVSETYGYAEVAYFDNTRAAASKQITGGIRNRNRWKHKEGEPLGVLPMFGIRVVPVTPYHGQSKPIERANRDLKQAIERDPRVAEAYSGDDPRQRDGRAPKSIPLSLFREVVGDAIAHHNAMPGRRTQACKGRLSFDQAFADSYRENPQRKALPAHRVYWLHIFKEVRCRKERGEIRLLDNRFHAPELVNYRGKNVIARFDPLDVQRGLIVETLDGRRLCEAPCIARTGFNDTRAMREHQRLKKAHRRAVKDSLAAKRKLNAAEVSALMARAEASAAPEPSVVEIVRPKTRPAEPKPAAESAQDKARRDRNFRANVERLATKRVAGM